MLLGVRVIYGKPLVVMSSVKPVAPDSAFSVALVVLRPVGVVQVPEPVVQYQKRIEPTSPVVGTVTSNLCVVTALGAELPKVTLRGDNDAADATFAGIALNKTASILNTYAKTTAGRFVTVFIQSPLQLFSKLSISFTQ
jgi:hypothetical protein